MTDDGNNRVRSAVEAVCRELGLDRWDARSVEQLVDSDPASWPSCCGGGCDPCVDVLNSAARRVLERLKGG